MALKREQEADPVEGVSKLLIDEDMTIYVIEELKQAITAEIDLSDTIELNLAGVEEVDSAGIQLLLALSRELQLKNKQLKLTALSPAVTKLFESYELTDRFNTAGAA